MNINQVMCAIAIVGVSSSVLAKPSNDECAAWICAAGAFAPSECKPPFKAMIKRIKKFKPPLPSISSCGANSSMKSLAKSMNLKVSDFTHQHGFAAYIPAARYCSGWDNKGNNCTGGYKTKPEQYIKGTSCVRRGGTDGDWTPHGCTATYRFVDIYADRKPWMDTFYWN